MRHFEYDPNMNKSQMIDLAYPQVLNFEGLCLPEDCGGPGGYADFFIVWNDPKHLDHESMRTWGTSQRFGEYNLSVVNLNLKMDMLYRILEENGIIEKAVNDF